MQMKTLGAMLVAVLGLVVCGPASAQESRKFNAKSLESTYQLPVYAPKGGVVSNEVVEANDDFSHLRTAVYALKGEPKKVLEFYGKQLGEPKKEVSDVGGDRFVFTKPANRNEAVRRKVLVQYDREGKVTQVTLWVKTYSSPEDAEGE